MNALIEKLRKDVPLWRTEARNFLRQGIRRLHESRASNSGFHAAAARTHARWSIEQGLRFSRNAARVERGELPNWGEGR